jgi:uncharacterized protein
MAGSSLWVLIDDIAAILDDVAVMSKVAAKKTAGVLGDDLALNAEQVTGVRAERELPVVWAVAKGSMKNKAILVPSALAISALLPVLVIPLLMLGGAFLCYEGFEKLVHKFLHGKEDAAHHAKQLQALSDESIDLVQLEKDKIKGAVRTDFILSAEILVITLGTVAAAPFGQQVAVMVAIALLITVGVYGLVAAIVKLDDVGLHWSARGGVLAPLGRGLVSFAPYLMKFLSIAGTAAMFLVGGGILTHGISVLEHGIADLGKASGAVPGVGVVLEALVPTLINGLFGVIAGAVILGVVLAVKKLFGKKEAAA